MLMAIDYRCLPHQEMDMPVAYPDHTAGPYTDFMKVILIKVCTGSHFMVVVVDAAGDRLT
jgi:hypothetical protein